MHKKKHSFWRLNVSARKELIETVANKTGKSQKDVKETLEAILSTINETMHTLHNYATKLFQYWSDVKSHLNLKDFEFFQSKFPWLDKFTGVLLNSKDFPCEWLCYR